MDLVTAMTAVSVASETKDERRRTNARPPRLILDGVGKRFVSTHGQTVDALLDVLLEVKAGEFVCVLGRSGCGKSTLLRLVAGLERPTAGRILLDGRPVSGPGPDRAMVFQEHLLFPWRTVEQNVAYGLEARGVPPAERREKVAWALELVGLERFARSYPKELSGGMKQRAGIARAVVNQPEVLLLDEPFASLDAQTRSDLQIALLEIWVGTRPTVLFVTHSVDEAVYLADRVLVLHSGADRPPDVLDLQLPRPRYRVSPAFNRVKRLVMDTLGVQTAE
jgi:NitT/TauT family transport system ATP-binding protein